MSQITFLLKITVDESIFLGRKLGKKQKSNFQLTKNYDTVKGAQSSRYTF